MSVQITMNRRKFLFLQGPATLFYRSLIKSINDSGYDVYQVSFCGGDWIFGFGQKRWRFNGSVDDFSTWIGEKLIKHGFTDVVLFGDMRPLHMVATKVAKELNIRTYVFEEGYLRPDWVTLEISGVNANSKLMMKDINWYDAYVCPQIKKNPPSGSNLYVRFFFDLCYRLATLLLFPFFSQYKTHRPHNAIIEYLGWARRYPLRYFYWQKEKKFIQQLVDNKKSYFFFPLQLNSDSQIQKHSDFGSMVNAMVFIIKSFANKAPRDSLLIIKNHPLDTGLIPYRRIIDNLAKSLSINDRVVYLENGHIPTLTQYAKGTVVVNSTVGMSALVHHNPTCVLGKAVYNLPGLTCQSGLDEFWNNPKRPNPVLFKKFRNAVINLTQVNGNFYSKKGIDMAVAGSLNVMGVIATVNTDEALAFYGSTSQSLN